MSWALAGLVLAFLPQGEWWERVWTGLETLRAGRVTPAERELLRDDLQHALEQSFEEPRIELLRASLESLSGRDASVVARRLAGLDPSPFSPRELWFVADLLPPGAERSRLVLGALGVPAPLADWQVLLAWNTAVEEARALHLEAGALPIQEALHARFRAAWSAEDLALTYRQLGRMAEADGVLEAAIGLETSSSRRAGLWQRRGLNSLGFGDERAARDYLGRALAECSEDAGLVLSKLDLGKGRTEAARHGFQALILDRPPSDWAWRGWGLALLSPPFAAPATRLPPQNE